MTNPVSETPGDARRSQWLIDEHPCTEVGYLHCETCHCADFDIPHRGRPCAAPRQLRIGKRRDERRWQWAITIDGTHRAVLHRGSAWTRQGAERAARRMMEREFLGTAVALAGPLAHGRMPPPKEPPARALPPIGTPVVNPSTGDLILRDAAGDVTVLRPARPTGA